MKIIIYNPATHLFDFFIDSLKYELTLRNIDLINYNNNINIEKDIPILIIVNPHFIFDIKEIYETIINISKYYKIQNIIFNRTIKFYY